MDVLMSFSIHGHTRWPGAQTTTESQVKNRERETEKWKQSILFSLSLTCFRIQRASCVYAWNGWSVESHINLNLVGRMLGMKGMKGEME